MLDGSISGLGLLDTIAAKLQRVANPDLRPLAESARTLMIEDNRAGLLIGTDATGRPMAPLAPSTLRHRDGSGPPGVPHGEQSRLIADYDVTIEPGGPGGLRLVGSYGAAEELRQRFQSGTKDMPARPIAGIRPRTMTLIGSAVRDEAGRIVADFSGDTSTLGE